MPRAGSSVKAHGGIAFPQRMTPTGSALPGQAAGHCGAPHGRFPERVELHIIIDDGLVHPGKRWIEPGLAYSLLSVPWQAVQLTATNAPFSGWPPATRESGRSLQPCTCHLLYYRGQIRLFSEEIVPACILIRGRALLDALPARSYWAPGG
jgi:hypothetical protein